MLSSHLVVTFWLKVTETVLATGQEEEWGRVVELMIREAVVAVGTRTGLGVETGGVFVYAQVSLPVKAEVMYRARGRPLVMEMARFPEVSAEKTSQLRRSVNLVLGWIPVFAAGKTMLPLLPAPRFVNKEMR